MVQRVDFYESSTDLEAAVAQAVLKTDVVLDIGCGIRPMGWFEPKLYICIEPFFQYVELMQERFRGEPGFIILQVNAIEGLASLPNNSVDSVYMLDMIEHIPKEMGMQLLKECERVARKQVVICTPLGFMEQKYESGSKDAWGLDGAELQEHKSGWLPADFDDSWRFLVCEKYHTHDSQGLPFDKIHGAFYAIKDMVNNQKTLPKKLLLLGSYVPPSDPGLNIRDCLLQIFKKFDPSSYGVLSTRNQQPHNISSTLNILDYAKERLPCKYHFLDIPNTWSQLEESMAQLADLKSENPNVVFFKQALQLLQTGEYQAIAVCDERLNELLLAYALSQFFNIPIVVIHKEGYSPNTNWNVTKLLAEKSLFLTLPEKPQENELDLIAQKIMNFLSVDSNKTACLNKYEAYNA